MTSVTTIRPEHTAQRDAAIAASRSLVATSGLSMNVGCRSTPSHHTLTAAERGVFSVIQTGSRALRCFRHRFACQRRRRATLVIPPCKIRGVAMATGLGFRILPCGHLGHMGCTTAICQRTGISAATACCGDLASNSRDSNGLTLATNRTWCEPPRPSSRNGPFSRWLDISLHLLLLSGCSPACVEGVPGSDALSDVCLLE